MKNEKNNKGITLMALVITIVILIILASIGTYSGIQVVKSAQFTAFSTELKIMQTQVNSLYEKKRNGEKVLINNEEKEIENIGVAISDNANVEDQANNVFSAIRDEVDSWVGYRYYNKETIKGLGVEGVEGEFFVNIEDRSVVSYDGMKYEGKTYYTLKQLPDNLYNVEYNIDTSNKPTFELNVEVLKKGEWNVSVNTISYIGNISKWNLEYKLIGQEEYKSTKESSIKLNEEGTYKIRITNQDLKSEDKIIVLSTADKDYIKNHVDDYYGHYVTNYNSPNDAGINASEGEKWRIFMADDENIYLIASNFITRQYTGTKNNVGYNYDTGNQTTVTATKMWFDNLLGQYYANSTTTDIPALLSKFDNKDRTNYHKWMNKSENQTKNYSNEKAVASILDENIWSGYKNITYAKYAIGGPTIEMFCKSYNDTHTENQLVASEEYDYGYKIKKGTQDYSDIVENLDTEEKKILERKIYFKTSNEGQYYWLASTSANDPNRILRVSVGGDIRGLWYNNVNVGFLPIVCLNSNVNLVLNEDGETYSILES